MPKRVNPKRCALVFPKQSAVQILTAQDLAGTSPFEPSNRRLFYTYKHRYQDTNYKILRMPCVKIKEDFIIFSVTCGNITPTYESPAL